jgi:hypothetical protein
MKARSELNIPKVLRQFQEAERSPAKCKGTFKVDAPFGKRLDTAVKVGRQA